MTPDEPRIAELMADVAALQQQLTTLEQERHQAEQRAQLYETLFQRLPFAIDVWQLSQPDDPRSLRLLAANPASVAAVQQHGMDLRTKIGQPLAEIFPYVPPEQFRIHAEALRSQQPVALGEMTVPDPFIGERIIALRDIPLSQTMLCILATDITDRQRAEEMLRQSAELEAQIRIQSAALVELSTPLIPITDSVVVMPLIGTVDSRRAQQVMETLLEGIVAQGAKTAILDITGVLVVDTQVANVLLHAAQAVKLLGAQVIITGIRPEVAQTLIGLGADLSAIITLANLQSGITYATQRS